MRTNTLTLATAMEVLSREIYCEDGVATAAIAEAAGRLRDLDQEIGRLRAGIVECLETNVHLATGSPLRLLVKSVDNDPPDAREAKLLLESLRWKADMLVTNDFGERVWLKPLIIEGKRLGITDCCPEETPCDRHRRMANTPSETRRGQRHDQNP